MRLLPREQASPSSLPTLTLIPSPSPQDKLLLANLGFLAQKRLARGLKLNRTEAIALIAFQLQEFIRDGKHSVAELMQIGKEMLGRRHVLGGVEHAIHDVQVEGTFPVSLARGCGNTCLMSGGDLTGWVCVECFEISMIDLMLDLALLQDLSGHRPRSCLHRLGQS